MAVSQIPCPTVMRLLLRYEPVTGKLFWRQRARCWFISKRGHAVWNARYSEAEALCYKDNHGYQTGAVLLARHMKAHRAIWAITQGKWPEGHVDHMNGDRTDNRIENLRDVSQLENQQNLKKNSRNKSGQVGVFWHKEYGRWWAYIGSGLTRVTLGFFENKQDAIDARLRAQSLAGYHAMHGLTEAERMNISASSANSDIGPRQ